MTLKNIDPWESSDAPTDAAPIRLQRRSDLDRAGFTRRGIERELRTGTIERIHPGIYVPTTVDDEFRWRQQMAANLARAGDGSALSHRCAAFLHRLDGFRDLEIARRSDDLSVRRSSTFRTSPAIRVRQLPPTELVLIRGLAVTSVLRTLADLGRFVDADEVEMALECALRIDPRRPDQWNEQLLGELLALSETGGRGRTGLAVLRTVLRRRPPGARPTGSPAETRAVQALRPVGLGGLTRQPTIRIMTQGGTLVRKAFPDIGDLDRLFFIEIDGLGAHSTSTALDRDLRRQNDLTDIFRVVRFSASRVHTAPLLFAEEVLGRWQRAAPEPRTEWRTNGFVVRRSVDGLDVFVPTGYR